MGIGQGRNPRIIELKIRILDAARQDLVSGFRFYEAQEVGLGSYFLDSLYADIDALKFFAGVHMIVVSLICCCKPQYKLKEKS